MRDEYGSTIADDLAWESVLSVDVVEEELCEVLGVGVLLARNADYTTTEVVVNVENHVEAFAFWQRANEVHRNDFKGARGDFVRLKRCMRAFAAVLDTLTGLATHDVSDNVSTNAGPPVRACDEFLRLVASRMSRDRRIVMGLNDIRS